MATQIQLRRVDYDNIGESDFTGTVPAAGEPIVVFDPDTQRTPRIYIGVGGSTTIANHTALGGPNSITADQIVGLSGITPNGSNFANSGSAGRLIGIDANGAASITQLNTQSTTGNTNLTMSGDLTIGDIAVTDSGHDKNGIIADDDGIIKIQRAGASDTGNVIETYQGGGDGSTNKKLQIAVDGDFAGVKDVTMTGKLGIGAQGANLEGTFIHAGATHIGLSPSSDADDIFVESDGNTGITIGSGASGTGNVVFGDTGGADIGKIQYKHSDNSLNFHTGAVSTPRLAIGGGGDIIATGSIAMAGGTSATTTTSINGTTKAYTGDADTSIATTAFVNNYAGVMDFARILFSEVLTFSAPLPYYQEVSMNAAYNQCDFILLSTTARSNNNQNQVTGYTAITRVFVPTTQKIAVFTDNKELILYVNSTSSSDRGVVIHQEDTGTSQPLSLLADQDRKIQVIGIKIT